MRRHAVLLALPWLMSAFPTPGSDPILDPEPANQLFFSPSIRGSRGAVACESMICSQIGIDIFQQGGNAADAMVAVNLCVGVIGMYHSGIGGGGFMLIRDKNGRKESLDYRETAPAAAREDMYAHNEAGSRKGGLAVGVPGELRGLQYLHDKYGALPWSTVVMPAVRVARDGFPVNADTLRFMQATMRMDGDYLVTDPIWAQDFAPNGTLLGLGDILTRKRLANTLQTIAEKGVEDFYEGDLAKSIINLVQEKDGIMTLDDLRNYTVHVQEPLGIDFRGYKLFTTDAPSSGSVSLNMLNTLEKFPTQDLWDGNLTLHRLVEAMKFAYGARMELGDPTFVNFIDSIQKQMLSDERADHIRNLIRDNETQDISVYDPTLHYTREGHGTSHIVVTDASGLVISSTTTVNLLFGAQIMTPDTGIILNNEMDDFSIPHKRNAFGFPPSPANFIRPGKRPLSSITPIIAEHANGSFYFATGAAGGSRIISSTSQVAWRVLEYGTSMLEAIAAPRVHHQLEPDELRIESTFDKATFDKLLEKKHNLTWTSDPGSSVQGVLRRWNGEFEAASETRQRGSGGLTI